MIHKLQEKLAKKVMFLLAYGENITILLTCISSNNY